MATDIILQNREVKVTGGELEVDFGLEVGKSFATNRPHLKFDLNGLTISNNQKKTIIKPNMVISSSGSFTNVRSKTFNGESIDIGQGNADEPRSPGQIDVGNGMGTNTISLNGRNGNIECRDIQLETIGSLVQIIRQLQNDIRNLKNQ